MFFYSDSNNLAYYSMVFRDFDLFLLKIGLSSFFRKPFVVDEESLIQWRKRE